MDRFCNRCDNQLQVQDEDWSNSGTIHISRASQIFKAVRRHFHTAYFRHVAEKDDFDFWSAKDSWPSVIAKMGAQDMTLEWGSAKPYKLCTKCQDELLAFLGEFFIPNYKWEFISDPDLRIKDGRAQRRVSLVRTEPDG